MLWLQPLAQSLINAACVTAAGPVALEEAGQDVELCPRLVDSMAQKPLLAAHLGFPLSAAAPWDFAWSSE